MTFPGYRSSVCPIRDHCPVTLDAAPVRVNKQCCCVDQQVRRNETRPLSAFRRRGRNSGVQIPVWSTASIPAYAVLGINTNACHGPCGVLCEKRQLSTRHHGRWSCAIVGEDEIKLACHHGRKPIIRILYAFPVVAQVSSWITPIVATYLDR